MKLISRLTDFSPQSSPIALTIGNFDGVHVGHLFVLKRLRELSKALNTQSIILTFSNHPSSILRPKAPVEPICTFKNKLRLFEAQGIDTTIALNFDVDFSQLLAQHFLLSLRKHVPFSTLVFGSDTAFGKNRQGDQSTIRALAQKSGFTVEYLDKVTLDEQDVSSTRIRNAIKLGDFNKTSKLLGRPYSIVDEVSNGKKTGSKIGYPTINIHVSNLCLPPMGVYASTVLVKKQIYPAVANLGFAPTFGNTKEPILEVHLIDKNLQLYGEVLEIFLKDFIREEKKFDSVDKLKTQISLDLEKARCILAVK